MLDLTKENFAQEVLEAEGKVFVVLLTSTVTAAFPAPPSCPTSISTLRSTATR